MGAVGGFRAGKLTFGISAEPCDPMVLVTLSPVTVRIQPVGTCRELRVSVGRGQGEAAHGRSALRRWTAAALGLPNSTREGRRGRVHAMGGLAEQRFSRGL